MRPSGQSPQLIRGWQRSRAHGCGCLLALAFGMAFWAAAAATVVLILRSTGIWR